MCMKTRLMLLQKGYHPNLHCALASDSGSYSLDTHSINSTCYYWLAPRNLHNNVLFIRHKYCHCFRAKIAFFMSLLLFCSRSSHLIKYFLLFLFQNSVWSLFFWIEETIWSFGSIIFFVTDVTHYWVLGLPQLLIRRPCHSSIQYVVMGRISWQTL